ncbi:hypothetical protein AB0C38_10210 [Amycolatopsis sp. NPDC048633]|uniref:hypothetical protein n=1 Tax=Amycolatopsis sp. NPDC048633 TaxID=3157095 RepID=UPI0034034227
MTFWSVTDFAALKRLARSLGASAAEAEVTARQQHAELTWDNELYMPWGSTSVTVAPSPDGQVIDPASIAAAETTIGWLQTVHAGWIFCTPNTLTETTEEHLPRTQRVRAERAGYRASPVRVVSVSRRSSPTAARREDEPSGRRVGIRFPVAPFIRRQAYGPGRQLRRLTPVAGH